MKVKTNELIGPALDWAVAKCEGRNITIMRNDDGSLFPQPVWSDGLWQQNYSTSWGQGGPIIERERIGVWWGGVWHAKYDGCKPEAVQDSDYPLIAAMRCFVFSKLGDEVDVPEELL